MSQVAGAGTSEFSVVSAGAEQPGSGSVAPAASRASRSSRRRRRPCRWRTWPPAAGASCSRGRTSAARSRELTPSATRLSAIVAFLAQSTGALELERHVDRVALAVVLVRARRSGRRPRTRSRCWRCRRRRPGATWTSASQKSPQPGLMPTVSSVGSSPMPMPELAAHAGRDGDLAVLGRVAGVRAARVLPVGLAVAVVVEAVVAAPLARRRGGGGGGRRRGVGAGRVPGRSRAGERAAAAAARAARAAPAARAAAPSAEPGQHVGGVRRRGLAAQLGGQHARRAP